VYWIGYDPDAAEPPFAREMAELKALMDAHALKAIRTGDALRAAVRHAFDIVHAGCRDRLRLMGSALTLAGHLRGALAERGKTSRGAKHDVSSGELIGQAIALVEKRLPRAATLAELASACHVGKSTMNACFKEATGLAPHEYVTMRRIDHARKVLLDDRKATVSEIARRLGFSSSQYFARAFKRATGKSPKAYRSPSPRGRG